MLQTPRIIRAFVDYDYSSVVDRETLTHKEEFQNEEYEEVERHRIYAGHEQ
jgi:hypothetical protein